MPIAHGKTFSKSSREELVSYFIVCMLLDITHVTQDVSVTSVHESVGSSGLIDSGGHSRPPDARAAVESCRELLFHLYFTFFSNSEVPVMNKLHHVAYYLILRNHKFDVCKYSRKLL